MDDKDISKTKDLLDFDLSTFDELKTAWLNEVLKPVLFVKDADSALYIFRLYGIPVPDVYVFGPNLDLPFRIYRDPTMQPNEGYLRWERWDTYEFQKIGDDKRYAMLKVDLQPYKIDRPFRIDVVEAVDFAAPRIVFSNGLTAPRIGGMV